MVVLGYGLGLIAAGLAAIAVRGALKGPFVDSLANTEAANVPAAARLGHRHLAAARASRPP